jgi:hypothetical protein
MTAACWTTQGVQGGGHPLCLQVGVGEVLATVGSDAAAALASGVGTLNATVEATGPLLIHVLKQHSPCIPSIVYVIAGMMRPGTSGVSQSLNALPTPRDRPGTSRGGPKGGGAGGGSCTAVQEARLHGRAWCKAMAMHLLSVPEQVSCCLPAFGQTF